MTYTIRFNVLTILLFLYAGVTNAKEVIPATAVRIAKEVMQRMQPLRSDIQLELVYTADGSSADGLRTEVGYPLFYVFNYGGEDGFVMIAGDDRARPILAYSDKGAFRTDDIPDNLRYWLSCYEEEIASVIHENKEPSANIRAEWEGVDDFNRAEQNQYLIPTVNWSQTQPYNYYCPEKSRKKTVTGCVATAMAIAMKHHEWPVQGSGTIDYTTRTSNIRIQEELGEVYDWENMLHTYNTSNPSWDETEMNAVARLIYDCGVACEMDFGTRESGAYLEDALSGFKNHFDYDPGTYMTGRDFFTQNEWNEMVASEILADRPVVYVGYSANAGHCFVIDGVDNDMFHVNWGWNGMSNGYFLLSALDPDAVGTGGGDSGYNSEQGAVFGLQKPREAAISRSELWYYDLGSSKTKFLGVKVDADTVRQNQPFKFYFSYITDYGSQPFDGEIGVFLTDKEGKRKSAIDIYGVTMEKHVAVYDDKGEEYTITDEVTEGDRIQMFFRTEGDTWRPVRGRTPTVMTVPAALPGNETGIMPPEVRPAVAFSMEKEYIRINTSENETIHALQLYDMTGKILQSQPVGKQSESVFPVESVMPGTYILKAVTGKTEYWYKFIKK